VATDPNYEDRLVSDLKEALAAGDSERAKALIAGVPSGVSKTTKAAREKFLWEIWSRVGFKPPDLPPFS